MAAESVIRVRQATAMRSLVEHAERLSGRTLLDVTGPLSPLKWGHEQARLKTIEGVVQLLSAVPTPVPAAPQPEPAPASPIPLDGEIEATAQVEVPTQAEASQSGEGQQQGESQTAGEGKKGRRSRKD